MVTKAAMLTTLTSDFVDSYNMRLLESISELMRTLEMEEYCSKSEVGDLFTTHLCIGKQKVASYGVKEESSRLSIDHSTDSLSLRLSGITFQFEFDFRLWSEPTWLHDAGSGVLSVINTDVNLSLVLRKDAHGRLKVEAIDRQVHSRGYDVDLKGQSDISRAVQNMLSSFKVFFEEELITLISSRIETITEKILAQKLLPQTDGQSFGIETKFSCNPIFSKNFITFIQEMSFGGESGGARPQETYSPMPVLLADEQNSITHAQKFISEQILNQAIESMFLES
mmetsp:Transcript_24495/g.30534  ORF Transcript_24495/g.30534 Transcript_24495/m.30534 type:complete len:282 (+) Transcript_24495:270-1115(+)